MAGSWIIDCSVVAKWFVNEPDSTMARLWLASYERGDTELIAPSLLRLELASAFSKRVRRGLLPAAEARAAWKFFDRCTPRLIDAHALLSEAFELSLRNHISSWDALYLALAIERRCLLVTADLRLLRLPTALKRYVHPFSTTHSG